MDGIKRLGLVGIALGALACGSSAAPPASDPPEQDAAAPVGGKAGSSDAKAPPIVDAATATPPDANDSADTATLPPDGEDAASMPGPDAAPTTPDAPSSPLGPFPLEAIKAAKPTLYVSAGTHLEGPSWHDGELFFAADGGGYGLMRVDAAGKLYRYQPKLTPIGTFALADGSLLACDHTYFL